MKAGRVGFGWPGRLFFGLPFEPGQMVGSRLVLLVRTVRPPVEYGHILLVWISPAKSGVVIDGRIQRTQVGPAVSSALTAAPGAPPPLNPSGEHSQKSPEDDGVGHASAVGAQPSSGEREVSHRGGDQEQNR